MKTKVAIRRVKALKALERARKLAAGKKSPFAGMSEQQIIDKIRKDREEIWEEKFASRP